MGTTSVKVLNADGTFLEETTPAKARILLKSEEAKVYSKNPFVIQISTQKPVASIRRRKKVAIRNYTEAFKEEKDIYVQNLANAQVSVEFPMGEGRVEGFTFPHNRDPINLTQHIPFDAIKKSMDFRKMLARRPPALQLLSQEEYESYYTKRAKALGYVDQEGQEDVDAAIDAAEEKRRRLSDKSLREPVATTSPEPLHQVVEEGTGPGGANRFGERTRVAHDDMVDEDEVINPRVLHLCNQVKSELEQKERMSARDLLDELDAIPNLSLDDLEHIRAHGYYKTVKTWAKKAMSKLNEQMDEQEEATA